MSTLILVTCDSGAGHLKREKRADRILAFAHRLVTGPVPVNGPPETFFERQRALYVSESLFHESWWFEAEDVTGDNPLHMRAWSRLPEVCLDYDRIELWIDPDPNAQLMLLQLLDWLGRVPEIAPRLWLKQAESPLGERRLGDLVLPPRPIEPTDVALASRAWAAFGIPTPDTWAELRNEAELIRLPGLKRAVGQLLGELPDRSGLGATARRILGLVERPAWPIDSERRGEGVSGRTLDETDRRYGPLMRRILGWGERCPLDHFEIGQTLCDLGTASAPAISGVTERRFDLEMHDDTERFRRFRETPLSLTELGRRLVAGEEDWALHNLIHRWWGGTRLSNASLWRWDPTQERLSKRL